MKLFTESYAMTKSLQLIERQLLAVKDKTQKAPQFVLMAGGFGAARCLREAVGNVIGDGTTVLQGTDSSAMYVDPDN